MNHVYCARVYIQVVSVILFNLVGIMIEENFEEWLLKKDLYNFLFCNYLLGYCTLCLSLACVFMKISVQSDMLQFLVSSECVFLTATLTSSIPIADMKLGFLSFKVWVGLHEEWIFDLVPFILLLNRGFEMPSLT